MAVANYSPPAEALIKATRADFDRRDVVLPVHLVQYDDTLATFTSFSGELKGYGWVNGGSVRAPTNLHAGTWFIIANYTTY